MRTMLGAMIACILVAPGVADDAPPAAGAEPPAALAVELLGVPVRTMRRTGDFLVPKPDGAGWWFLCSFNPVGRNELPCQTVIVDLDSGAVRMDRRLPSGAFGKAVTGHDGRFIICHYAAVGVWIFDPATGSLEYVGHPDLDVRVSAQAMQVAGNDGRIFMGMASHRALLVEFDPATRAFRNFGVQGPAHPAPRYIYTMAVADDFVYSAAGKNPWYLVATNRETMAQRLLMADMDYLSVGGSGENCGATVTRDGVVTRYALRGGEAVDFEPSEPATRPAARPPRPELVLTGMVPDARGMGTLWWRYADGDWQSAELRDIQTMAWPFHMVRAMPDGRLLGVPGAYESFFVFDPATDRFETLGKSPLSASAVESIGERVFIMGYPGTYMVDYDPNRPWTFQTSTPEWKEPALTAPESNPRECHRWSVGIMPTHHVHGSAVGADGFVYFGGHAERAAVGGGLGWWDPVRRVPAGLREPFELHDCADLTAARDGALIVYSSKPVADPGSDRPRPDDAKLFVFDVAAKALAAEIVPVPGLRSAGHVLGVGDTVFGIGRRADGESLLYAVDLTRRETTRTMPLEAGSANLALGPDGRIYTFIGLTLVRIDPKTFELQRLGTVEQAGRLEWLGDDLYLAGNEQLRRIRAAATIDQQAAPAAKRSGVHGSIRLSE